MSPTTPAPDEVHDLRRCVRDLVALSTLPAVWGNADPPTIGRGLAEVLLRILSVDFLYVRLHGRDGGPPREAARTRGRAEPEARAQEIGKALDPWLRFGDADAPPTIPNPVGEGSVRLAVYPIGHAHEYGLLAAGCGRSDFPTDAERLLLGVAVNQAAGLLQRKEAEEALRKQSERLRVTLASIGDAVIATDTEGRVSSLNPVAESLTGWTQEEAQGAPLEQVFRILNEYTRRPVENPATRALREGRVVGLANHTILVARDGTERPIDDSAAPIKDDRGEVVGVVVVFRDVSERKRAEQRRNARLAVISALSQAATVDDGVGGVLRAVCESLAWDVGFFWTVDERGAGLVCRHSWHRPDVPVGEFESASCSRTLSRGEGLPGRVWASGRPAWILDLAQAANFPRLAPAVECGLRSAIACPVVVGDRTLGVIEFFTERIRGADPDLLEMMGTVAGNLGQFIERKATEDELRRSEQELADFFENATVGLHWVGPDGTILKANQAELDLLGYCRDEYVGRPVADFHADEDVICDILKRLQAGEKLTEYPARLKCKDGSVKDVLIDSSVLWKDGRFVHTRCFTRDVTERKRAEARVREAERRFQAVFNQQFQFMALLAPDGTVLEANETCFRATGVERERVLGRLFWETPWWDRLPAMQEQWQRFVSEAAVGGGPVTGEAEYALADGTTRLAAVVVTGLKDESGRVASLVVEGRDDTERKQQEVALRQSEEKFRQLAEHIQDVFWMADLRRPQVLYVSPAYERVWGRTCQGLYQQPRSFLEAVHPDDRRRVFASLGRQARGEPTTEEYRVVRPDGSVRWVLDRAFPIRDEAGTVYRVAGIAEDITERKQIETELRDARSRLDDALEAGATATWTWDIPNNRLFTDGNLARLFNLPPSEAEGGLLDRYVQSIHPDDWPRVSAALTRSVQSGEDYEADYRILQPDGSVRWVVARGRAERDEAGRPVRMPGVLVDITERKRLEAELRLRVEQLAEADHRKEELLASLRESEEKLRLLADTIPQLAWMARPDGHIFWYNRRWYEYTGTTPEQMEGWGWQAVHDPDVLPKVLERWQGAITSGQPFDMVFPLRGADGQFRPFLTRVNPLKDEAGRILYWFGTNTDISEQQRASETARFLADASAALAGVVDYESTLGKVARLAVPFFADWCAVDMVSDDGTLRRLAVVHGDPSRVELAEELHRRYPPRPDDPYGPPHVLRTGEPEMAAEVTDAILVASARDEDHLRILRGLNLRSYISVPLVVRSKPLGVVTFLMSESHRAYGPADLELAQDLAHRAAIAVDNARLYQQLRDADRRKDEFLATLAHELRNPLAPIRNSLQILKLPRVDAATVRQTREMMERQVHHLVRLVDDLLDVSRVMRGKIELRREPVELATVVARAVETAQPLIEVQGHRLDLSLPPDSLLLHADPVRLAQVVGNLLTNAAKYTEANGHIRLTARREGGEAVLSVRDNGIGIAPDLLPHVFELFVQVDPAATRSQGGLGIGLTLVKNLVEMHGGTVEAHSAGLGKGCEFVVRLPLSVRERQEPPQAEDGEKRQDLPPPGHRLLVVDDNEDAADSLAMLLRLQGHEVRVAHDGPSCLTLATAYRPDLVFLDLGMPGMDGYEVARRIRRTPGLEKTVLAALTGWGQQEDRRRTAEAGFDHHLVKPPEPGALEGVLAGLGRGDRKKTP